MQGIGWITSGSGRKRFSNSTDRPSARLEELRVPSVPTWMARQQYLRGTHPSPRVSFLLSSSPSLIADRSTQTDASSGTPTYPRPSRVLPQQVSNSPLLQLQDSPTHTNPHVKLRALATYKIKHIAERDLPLRLEKPFPIIHLPAENTVHYT